MWRVIFLVVFRLFMPSKIGVCLRLIIGLLFYFLMFNYRYFFSSYLLKSSIVQLDSLAYYFIFLTFVLFLFVFILELFIRSELFYLLNISLFLVLMFFFFTVQAFYFFVFFEASFIFMFMIILFWGQNPERIESLNYFMIYSLVGSLPLLCSIMIGRESVCRMGLMAWGWTHFVGDRLCHTDDMNAVYMVDELNEGSFYWDGDGVSLVRIFYGYTIPHFFWILVFLFKFPVFGLHLWLPKAHVESPVYGSMLLAGIMIKLGVVGIFRLNFRGILFYYSWSLVKNLFYYFCLGLVIVKLICRRQFDLKSFVAYSSVVHMSLIVIRVWAGTLLKIVGSLLMSFAHGLCSSALFLKFNKFYLVRGTRKVYLNRGFIYLFARVCFFWFMFCAVNCSMPISLSFFSEVFLIFSGVSFNIVSLVIFLFNVFFCGLYCIILYLLVRHGKRGVGLKFGGFYMLMYNNLLVLWYHFFVVYFYFVFYDRLGGLM